MAEKVGKPILFPSERRVRRTLPSSEGVMKSVTPERCLRALGGVAPDTEPLHGVLRLPDKLYPHYTIGSGPEYSSDPENGISALALSLLFSSDIEPSLLERSPDYGLMVLSRSSSVFCVLLDKSRKLVVMDSLGNYMGADLTWEFFARAVENAAAKAREMETNGEKFRFFLWRESERKIIP